MTLTNIDERKRSYSFCCFEVVNFFHNDIFIESSLFVGLFDVRMKPC